MRRHHFLVLAFAIIAVLVAAMTFRARKAAGQAVDQYLVHDEHCTKREPQTRSDQWVTHGIAS